jgi:hypothetical protein
MKDLKHPNVVELIEIQVNVARLLLQLLANQVIHVSDY